MFSDDLGAPLDPQQLARIEAVHRGFFYQHLYAVGCLLLMPVSAAEQVLIERDEDVEVVQAGRRLYVQVKTRSRALEWHDISSAVARFDVLRDEHSEGHRPGDATFAVVSNAEPGPGLKVRMASPSWPKDMVVLWPGGPSLDTVGALPPAWVGTAEALEWCTSTAGEIPFATLPARTMALKLAALVAHSAAGGNGHRIVAADLPDLFEQLVVQLQDFPAPPPGYRAQESEPDLKTSQRVRLIIGFSGAGKTAWASQAAVHATSDIAYFDVGDLAGSSMAVSLARDLAARFINRGAGNRGGAKLPAGTGLDILRLINQRLADNGAVVTVVLDNIHRLSPTDVRSLVEAARNIRFVMLGQPWPGLALLEAQLGLRAETLGGWPLDAVADEFKARGCPTDAATVARIRQLTGGLPLYVQNAALLTQEAYGGDAMRFCAAVEKQSDMTGTAQEIILAETFDQLSAEVADAAALLALANVPLTDEEISELLRSAIGDVQETVRAVRELKRHGLVQTFLGGRHKLHDACRILAQSRLESMGEDMAGRARTALRDLLYRSLQEKPDLGRIELWMRMLAHTGRIDVLIDLATREHFHELGDPGDLKELLETAAESEEFEPGDRFWALDALAFWDYQEGQLGRMPERVGRMENLVETYGLGLREQSALHLKQMSISSDAADKFRVDAAFAAGTKTASDDATTLRILRYNYANALFRMGEFDEAADSSWGLVLEYYDHLGIDLSDVIMKNPDEILERLQDTPSLEEELKHLADCLHLYMLARTHGGEESGMAGIHAMKFYITAGAWRSAARAGQDVVDEFLERGDAHGAREVMEGHVLPLLRAVPLVDLMVSLRSQYAVVVAWSGDVAAARSEMAALRAYKVSRIQQSELENQSALIEAIAAGNDDIPSP